MKFMKSNSAVQRIRRKIGSHFLLWGKTFLVASFAVGVASLIARERNVLGAGKKRPVPQSGLAAGSGGTNGCSTTNGQPLRSVILRPVSTKPFQLPNGATVDLSADLDAMWTTAVTQTGVFSPLDFTRDTGAAISECDETLELRAAVSSLELNAVEVGVSFGYSPTGSESPIVRIGGTAKVKVGAVRMEFGVRQCRSGRCQELIATGADHATAGVGLDFTIDFTAVKTGPSLVANTQLGAVLQQVLGQGAGRLAQDARVARLPWSATVRESASASQGLFVMDAGAERRLQPGTRVEVYAVTPGASACNVYKVVAYGTAIQVHSISATVALDQLLDPRGVQEGDLVRLRAF